MTPMNHEEYLHKYAELVIRIGLNLQPGQRLIVFAPLEAAPLVRQVTAVAYQAGCRLVDVFWNDDLVNLARYQYAPRDSFEEFPGWRTEGILKHVQEGGALLNIMGTDPDLLKEQDPDLIATAQRTGARHYKPISALQSRNQYNWAIVGYPVTAWALKMFPGEAPEAAVGRLWEAIFQVCRLEAEDPVAAWEAHIAGLVKRSERLNAQAYRWLKLRAPGTDLTLGLFEGHHWGGGRTLRQDGLAYTPNLPTEEVFTTPHKDQTEGVVTASRPLSTSGQLVENFRLTFEGGRVVDIKAEKGEAILRKLIETDEGAARLGEVALVPHSSPISQSGLLFYNTLFDENAACHIALGRGFKFAVQDGEKLSDEEFTSRGGNMSLLHIDFMIGSDQMDIDGVTAEGVVEPLMRAGEWAFD
jgi:aminopeptidase